MKSESESFDPLGVASPRLAQLFGLLCQELCFQLVSTTPDDPHSLDGAKVAVGAGRMFVEGFVVLFRSLHHTALRWGPGDSVILSHTKLGVELDSARNHWIRYQTNDPE